jgi:hypothetical protein
VQAPGHGPSWNRFSYAYNNPLRYTDPSGYDTECGSPGTCAPPTLPPIFGGAEPSLGPSANTDATARPSEPQKWNDTSGADPGPGNTPAWKTVYINNDGKPILDPVGEPAPLEIVTIKEHVSSESEGHSGTATSVTLDHLFVYRVEWTIEQKAEFAMVRLSRAITIHRAVTRTGPLPSAERMLDRAVAQIPRLAKIGGAIRALGSALAGLGSFLDILEGTDELANGHYVDGSVHFGGGATTVAGIVLSSSGLIIAGAYIGLGYGAIKAAGGYGEMLQEEFQGDPDGFRDYMLMYWRQIGP